mgnify:CR=1 FL=1
MQTPRGCPFDCEFCAASIRRIKEIWPDPFIEFSDDNTFANKKHGKELLRAIERIRSDGITVEGCFEPGLDGTGPDSFRQIRDSGLYEVQITIQTAFPATPLYERLRRESRLIDETAWELSIQSGMSRGWRHAHKPRVHHEYQVDKNTVFRSRALCWLARACVSHFPCGHLRNVRRRATEPDGRSRASVAKQALSAPESLQEEQKQNNRAVIGAPR